MEHDWQNLDEEEAARVILREAIACGCHCAAICGSHGAEIYFEGQGELRIFTQLPERTACAVKRYFRDMAGIEPFREPPAEGVSAISLPEGEYTLTVKTAKGSCGEELRLALFKL